MPDNAADIAADYATEHGFKLLRVAAGFRQDALAILEDLEKELASLVTSTGEVTANSAKLAAMQAEAKVIISQAYKYVAKTHDGNLSKLATIEWDATNAMLNKAIGVEVVSGKIPDKLLEAVTQAPVVLGFQAKDWWAGQDADLRANFQRQMALGTLIGETNSQLVKRIIGSGIVQAGEPGIMKKAKRDAEALVLTSTQSIANHARIESFKAKPNLIKGIQWVSTLDSRTTIICMALDGKQWRLPDFQPVGHDKKFPGATAHWRCRSTQISVLYSWSELAGKKLPELDNAKLQDRIDEKLKAAGKTPEQIIAAKAQSRASMDGQVAKGQDYGTWAAKKGTAFVEQVLGPGRAALFNAGQITFSDLTDQNNRPITLAQHAESVNSGKPPPETLGVKYLPLTKPAKFVDVQAVADAAAKKAAAEAAQQAAIKAGEEKAAALKAAAEAAAKAKKEAEDAALKASVEAALQAKKLQDKKKEIAKSLATGKKLTKGQDDLWQTFTGDEKDQISDMVDAYAAKLAKKQAKASASVTKPDIDAKNLDLAFPDISRLVFVQNLPGSTGPKLMQDPVTGKQWVVKMSDNDRHLMTEAAADEMYRLLGVRAPGSIFIEDQQAKLAEYIPNGQSLGNWMKKAKPAEQKAMQDEISRHFVVDALLGNWDVAGATLDNIIVVDGKPIRIDNGGAFNMRAQGAFKTPEQWNATVAELKTMRDAATNPSAAKIFAGITQSSIDEQIAAVLRRKEDIIQLTWDRLGTAQANIIKGRLAYLETLLPPTAKTTITTGPLEFDATFEKAALTRYGASLRMSKETFEDQEVIVWHERDTAKNKLVKAQGVMTMAASDNFVAKLQSLGFEKPTRQSKPNPLTTVNVLDPYYGTLLAAAKTVGKHAADGKYNAVTIKDYENIKAVHAKQKKKKGLPPDVKAMLDLYQTYIDSIDAAIKAKAAPALKLKQFTPPAKAATPAQPATNIEAEVNGVRITKLSKAITYTKKEVVGGELLDTGITNRETHEAHAFQLARGNVEITVVPYLDDAMTRQTGRSYQGVVRINVKGGDAKAAMIEAAAVMQEAGFLDVLQPTKAQRELLYLHKGVYLRGDTTAPEYLKALATPGGEEAVVEAVKTWAEKQYGVKLPRDGSTSRYYNPDGELPITGVGNRIWRRWDITEKQGLAAESKSKFWHKTSGEPSTVLLSMIQGGGHATTTTARLRTGIGMEETSGGSPDSDTAVGGGAYFYTNHAPKDKRIASTTGGFVFKGENVTRIDLASHTDDSYGEWSRNNIKDKRRRTLSDIQSTSGIGYNYNTGLFKNGLSLAEIENVIVADATEAARLIRKVRDLGLDVWYDGRQLDKVIIPRR